MSRSYDTSGGDIVVVEGGFKHETEKATLLIINAKECWFPKSQLKKPSVQLDSANNEWAIFVPKWLAKKHGVNWDEYDEEDYPAHASDYDPSKLDTETGELLAPDDEPIF